MICKSVGLKSHQNGIPLMLYSGQLSSQAILHELDIGLPLFMGLLCGNQLFLFHVN